MFENPRRGRQARNLGKNVPKILDLKSSSEQIFSENCRWVPLQRLNRRFQRKQETSLTVSFSHRKRTVAQKCHSNFNFLTAISICSGQFQFAHGNFNLFREISICSRQFQFTHGNFNLLTAISIYSGQFRNFIPKAISIFSLTTCRLRRPTVAVSKNTFEVIYRQLSWF